MKTNIPTLEAEVAHIRSESATAYNTFRDAEDRLYRASRELAKARKNGDN